MNGLDTGTILVELGRRRMVGGQEDMITDVALDLVRSRDTAPADSAIVVTEPTSGLD